MSPDDPDRMAAPDPVTGLPRRPALLETLRVALHHAQRMHRTVAVARIDIPNLQQIWGTTGREGAEMVLRDASRALLASIRDGDAVGRTPEGNFTWVLVGAGSPADTRRAIERIMARMPRVIDWDGAELHPRYHLGVALYPNDSRRAEQLIDRAQAAVTMPVNDPVVFFNRDDHAAVIESHHLETALRKAVEAGALELHYQPVLESATLEVRGFEALARWPQGPEGVPVAPATFIPIAERTGLIHDLDDWLLRTAAAQAAQWARAGYRGLRISVNVSPVQLLDEAFQKRFLTSLGRAAPDLAGNQIAVEVTESLLIQDRLRAGAALRVLGEKGVAAYMDDFGTGCSNIAELQAFPFAAVKIDQSFTQGLGTDPRSKALVRAIVAMANALELETIAEGGETEDQLSHLRELGARCVQGYLTGRPMPAAAATDLLESRGMVER